MAYVISADENMYKTEKRIQRTLKEKEVISGHNERLTTPPDQLSISPCYE